MPLPQILSRLTLSDAALLVGIAFAIGTGLHLIALKFASRGWKKTAHSLDAVSVLFLNAVAFARKIAAAFGRDLPVMTVAQTVAAADARYRVALASVPRQPAPTNSHGFATAYTMGIAFLAAVAAVFAFAAMHGCSSAQTHRAVTGVVVTAGTITNDLHSANRDVYITATNALRMRVHGADYSAASAPLDEQFRSRGRAIGALTSALYAVAVTNDAAQSGVTLDQRINAARDVLSAIREVTQSLARGDVLPPVPVPASVTAIENQMAAIAGAAQ